MFKLKLLLAALLAYLTLGVEPDPEAEAAAAAEAERIAAESAGELPNLEEEEEEEEPAGNDDDPDALRQQLATERTARETAERNHREAADRLAAAERQRTATPPGPSAEQQTFEQEEARLRDPKATEWDRWQIESSRTMRASARASQEALQNSREIADKADFDRLQASKPLVKKYAERVEKKLAEVRASGANLPRKVVLQLLIGEDIVDGKVKTGKKAATTTTTTTVQRGKPPAGRSDVRGRGTSSEQDKRRARLENQII